VPPPGTANYLKRRFQYCIFFRGFHYLFIIGLVWIFLTWPLWTVFQSRWGIIRFIIDDLLSISLLVIYLLFFLGESYRFDWSYQSRSYKFGSYLMQYGYYWLFILNILIYLRIDTCYLPFWLQKVSGIGRAVIEASATVSFLVIQMVIMRLRYLKMVKADFRLQSLIAETSTCFGIHTPTVMVWQLDGVVNAYTTALFSPKIFLTETLIKTASLEDLRLIIGHECSHIKYRHIPVRILAAGAILLLLSSIEPETFILRVVWYGVAGVGGFLAFQRLARFQEYQADAFAADRLSGREAMARALEDVLGHTSLPWKFGRLTQFIMGHPDLANRVKKLHGF
jgi:Zn-dependent protease with chaperone function